MNPELLVYNIENIYMSPPPPEGPRSFFMRGFVRLATESFDRGRLRVHRLSSIVQDQAGEEGNLRLLSGRISLFSPRGFFLKFPKRFIERWDLRGVIHDLF